MRTIAIINQKGGCGKTTTAINLAAVFARRGFRTLLVDLDPQSHCAAGLGVPESHVERDVGDAMLAPTDQPLAREQYLWRVTRGLDLLPSRTRLAGLEAGQGMLAGQEGKERRLESVLERLSREDESPGVAANGDEPPRAFDVCVIDCPPSIGLLTYNALVAARELLIPVETSYFSLQGADRQLKTMRSIARRLGVRHRARLVATIYDASIPIARDLLNELRTRYPSQLAPTIIRSDPALREAASVGRPIVDYAPDSPGAEDYTSLCEWLVEHAKIERGDLEDEGDRPSVEVVPSAGAVVLGSPREPVGAPPVATSARLAELADRVRRMKPATITPTSVAPAPVEMPTRAEAPPRPAPTPLLLVEPEPVKAPAAIDDDVRRLLGAVPTSRGVLFLQPLALGERIFIAGDFNGWSSTSHEMRRNPERGVFELHVPMPTGPRQYRLVVDGRWMPDPYASQSVLNEFGQPNSVVRVPPTA
ncbi:MAG: AAA family ATPase [Phycisphaerales bacterium]